jgi:hypothetical protein
VAQARKANERKSLEAKLAVNAVDICRICRICRFQCDTCDSRGKGVADRRQTSFPLDCVDKRSARRLGDDAGQRAGGERQPNLIFGPAEIGEVERNEGAESGLDIGEEEIHPVQAALASARDRNPHRLAGAAITREHPPEATRPNGQASADRLVAVGEIDPHVRFQNRSTERTLHQARIEFAPLLLLLQHGLIVPQVILRHAT